MTLAFSERYKRYDPTVLTVQFEVPFPLFDDDDLKVSVDGVEITEFSVTASFSNGRSDDAVVRLVTPVTDVSVEVFGDRVPRRENNYLANSPNLAENLQRDMDAITAVLQEQLRDFSSALRVSREVESVSALALTAAQRAGRAIVFSPDGLALGVGPTLDEISEAADNAATASAAAVAAVAAAAIAEGNAAIQKPKTYQAADLTNPLILDFAPASKGLVSVYIDGVKQDQEDFTLSGDELTFTGGWPDLIDQVEVVILGAFATMDQSGLIAHDSIEDFVQWESSLPAPVPDGAVAFANGVSFRKEAGYDLPNLTGWRPYGDVLSLRHMADDAELLADFENIAHAAKDLCLANGWTLFFQAPSDGSPFVYAYCHLDIDGGDLSVIFDKNAEFFPEERFQVFDTDGSTTVFTLDPEVWDYRGDSLERYGAEFIPDVGNPIKLTIGDDISSAPVGDTYEFTVYDPNDPGEPLPADGKLKIVSVRAALSFHATSGSGSKLRVTGKGRFNISNGGVAIASGGRAGFGTTGVDDVLIDGAGHIHSYGSPETGPSADPLDRRGDSGVTPVNYKTFICLGVIEVEDTADSSFYMSGGPDNESDADDPHYLFVNILIVRRGQTVLKDTRQMRSGTIMSIYAEDCVNFYTNAPQIGIEQGRNFHIVKSHIVRLQRRGIFVNENTAPITFGDVTIEDFGFDNTSPTGGNLVTGACAVFLSDATGVAIQNLSVVRRDWDEPTGKPIIQLEGDYLYGCKIDGYSEGFDILVNNSLNDVDAGGNEINLRYKDVTTPYTAAGAAIDNIRYRLTDVETNEVLTGKFNKDIGARDGTFVPAPIFAGGTATLGTNNSKMSYQNIGGNMHINCRVRVPVTHSETAKAFRIPMPFTADDPADMTTPLVMGRVQGFTLPYGSGVDDVLNVYAEMPEGQDYVNFFYNRNGGGTPILITSDHITTGTLVWLEFNGLVSVAG